MSNESAFPPCPLHRFTRRVSAGSLGLRRGSRRVPQCRCITQQESEGATSRVIASSPLTFHSRITRANHAAAHGNNARGQSSDARSDARSRRSHSTLVVR